MRKVIISGIMFLAVLVVLIIPATIRADDLRLSYWEYNGTVINGIYGSGYQLFDVHLYETQLVNGQIVNSEYVSLSLPEPVLPAIAVLKENANLPDSDTANWSDVFFIAPIGIWGITGWTYGNTVQLFSDPAIPSYITYEYVTSFVVQTPTGPLSRFGFGTETSPYNLLFAGTNSLIANHWYVYNDASETSPEPVPEPTTMLLLGLGLMGLGIVKRKFKSKSV
jgi:hypothetical protein